MYTEARKISLIEEVLKVDNEATLTALEAVLKKSRKKTIPGKKSRMYDFVGIRTKKEANTMRTAIAETCETIHADDWK